jgi:outer membrane protein assembly factor BamA
MPIARVLGITPTLALFGLFATTGAARAQTGIELPAPETHSEEPGAPFGPRYLVEQVEVRGNAKTRSTVIEHELLVHHGDYVSPDDSRVEASRFRVLGLGFFEDVRLSLRRGQARGRVVLVVDVVERNTVILNEIFLGTSEATPIWAGLDAGENNFLGNGVSVSAAFVASARADIANAEAQQAYRLRLWDPDLLGLRFGLGGELLASDGSEFYRALGNDSASDPKDFVALQYRRVGGAAAGGFEWGRIAHVRVSHRAEWIDATFPGVRTRTLPDGRLAAIDFGIREGTSTLSIFGVTVDFDTRSDPVLPQTGFRLTVDGQLATRIWGSSYDYGKLTLAYDQYGRLPWHHVLALRLYGGVIVGDDAPFFEQFFIGDLNRLLPPRALGLNFSTQPSRALLGLPAIEAKRYEPIAARAAVEYIWPLWRGHGIVYGGDLFALAGLLTLTSFDAIAARDRSLENALPLDLTLDIGLRLDTSIGIFTLSIANALGRIPF